MNLFNFFGITAASGGESTVAPPVLVSGPSVGGWGGVFPGELSCSTGTWEGAGITYSYLWNTSATTSSITINHGGQYYCTVRATNAGGYVEEDSNVAEVPEVPSNYELPAIGGSLVVGEAMSCSTGLWYGYPEPTFSYYWSPSGETTATIYPASTGDYYCVVTATNAIGNQNAQAPTVSVNSPPGSPPVNNTSPEVSGDVYRCGIVSCTTGSWDNGVDSYNYQWVRNSSDITDATSETYTLTNDDVGQDISCRVTAINASGSASMISNNHITAQQTFALTYNGGITPTTYSPTVWQMVGVDSPGSWDNLQGLPPAVAYYSSYSSISGDGNTFIQNGYGLDQTLNIDESLFGQFLEITITYTNLCGDSVTGYSGKFGPVAT